MFDLSFVTFILAIATFLLAGIAVWSILQTRSIHQKELKIRLLNEITEWVMGIQNISLDVIFPLSEKLAPDLWHRLEANAIFKYGNQFINNVYVKAIASGTLMKDLQGEVERHTEVFTLFFFLKVKSTGEETAAEAFEGFEAIEKVKKLIKEDPTQVEQLLSKYSKELSTSSNELLTKAGKIKANLLSS